MKKEGHFSLCAFLQPVCSGPSASVRRGMLAPLYYNTKFVAPRGATVVISWFLGFPASLLIGFVVPGMLAFWLLGFLASWLLGFLASLLTRFLDFWVPECLVPSYYCRPSCSSWYCDHSIHILPRVLSSSRILNFNFNLIDAILKAIVKIRLG